MPTGLPVTEVSGVWKHWKPEEESTACVCRYKLSAVLEVSNLFTVLLLSMKSCTEIKGTWSALKFRNYFNEPD